MVQPPLDHHYIVMHLGGAKHVSRRHDGAPVSTVAECRSLTLVPAGTAYVWKTAGPIAFAHLYLRPEALEHCIDAELDGNGRTASLIEKVGCPDPFLEPLFSKMLEELARTSEPSTLLLDSLLESFRIRLAQRHSSAFATVSQRAVALAPHRLRRVLDFIDANLDRDIALSDLVAAAGTSQFHFSRAFQLATGDPPYRYLLRQRIAYAKVLLMASNQPLLAISRSCGFNSQRQFAVIFKRMTGAGPKRFRMAHESWRRPLLAR